MKRILTLLGVLGAAFGLRAANPSFTDLVQTNVLWVAKNGNNSTAKPGNPALKYLTISNAVQAAVAPAVVKVAPGVYNESVNLKHLVNIELEAGADIAFTSAGALFTLTDNGSPVTNAIYGEGSVRRFGVAAGRVFDVSGNSRIRIKLKEYESDGASANGAIYISCVTCYVDIEGTVYSNGKGVRMDGGGASSFRGRVFSTNDYGITTGGDGSNYFSGTVFSWLNSAISPTSAELLTIENSSLISSNLYGLEVAGGDVAIRGTRIQSLRTVDGEGNAISKYGGNTLILDDVQLIAGPNNVYSIDNQADNTHGSIFIRNPCWANVRPNPAMNILSGSLIVSNTTEWKQPQIFRSVHGLTNIVARTNGNTWFPTGAASYSTIATNQIPVSGWTNNAAINVTVYVTATAVSFTVKNRAETVMYTSPVLTATIPVMLQPGWAINAASGLVGTVLPW